MKIAIYLTINAVLMAACNNGSKLEGSGAQRLAGHPAHAVDTTIILDSITEMDSVSTIMPPAAVIEVRIPAETLPVTRLQKTIDSETQSVQVLLTDLEPGLVHVSITHSRPDANIRISHVKLPDGSTDGPFGQQLNFEAQQKGNYTFIIEKSNMASGSQVGDLFITIEK